MRTTEIEGFLSEINFGWCVWFYEADGTCVGTKKYGSRDRADEDRYAWMDGETINHMEVYK